MKSLLKNLSIIGLGAIGGIGTATLATPALAADQDTSTAERVNVESIKEKYWARGEESELGVVQNRTYSKERKFELGVFGGMVTTDPFINVRNVGFSFGYHFSEYFSVQAFAWKDFVSKSSALDTFEQTVGATTNYNPPKSYYGGEAVGSVLYGKLSLLGKKIIYYDLHVLGGFGLTSTESGNYATPHIGIGQQIYLGKSISIRLDYRLMVYKETIIERVITTKIGQPVAERTNWTNAITLGVNFLFGPGAKSAPSDQSQPAKPIPAQLLGPQGGSKK